MKKLKILIIAFFSIAFFNNSYAQSEDNSDVGLWSAVGINYKLNKKLTFGLEEHIRFKENISEVDEYFTQFNTQYKLFKNFSLSSGLRYIRFHDTEGDIQGYKNYYRFNFDAKYKHKVNNFLLGYRFRYQNKDRISISEDAKQNFRLKASLKYNIQKWALDPLLSAEIFNKQNKNGDDNGFSKYRITLGSDYRIKKIGKIKFYYRLEKEFNTSSINNIIGLKYTYELKNK